MRRCPKCGHDEGPDWPRMIAVLSFFILFFLFVAVMGFAPPLWRAGGILAFTLFSISNWWRMKRDRRDFEEYTKLHSSAEQR